MRRSRYLAISLLAGLTMSFGAMGCAAEPSPEVSSDDENGSAPSEKDVIQSFGEGVEILSDGGVGCGPDYTPTCCSCGGCGCRPRWISPANWCAC